MSRVTLRDVAERAGVSTAATSQALNDRGNLRPETRDRIKAIAASLGYTPNKSAAALRSGRTMTIGFVMATNSLQDGRRALQRARQLDALVRAGSVRGFTVTVDSDMNASSSSICASETSPSRTVFTNRRSLNRSRTGRTI